MPKNRSFPTHEKRRRERDKQMKRQAKIAERQARSAAKRQAKLEGGGQAPEPTTAADSPPVVEPAAEVEPAAPPEADKP